VGHEINAVLEQAGLTVPATVLPCVNCHGDDGRGKAEGGVTPADISWQTLTKPYGIAHPGGRTRPPYTVPLLKRAITMGLDAAGQRLHVAMPRYQFSHSDLADLLAYLQQLGHAADPGVTETTIRLGTILPPRGFLAEMSQAIQAALMAYVDDINTQGGIYQRRIELLFDPSPEAAGARLPAARVFLAATQVFALVGSFMAGADADMAALVAEQEVPVVGAFALYPQVRFPLNRQVFYLSAGAPGQGQVLLTFMAHRYATAKPPLAILAPDEPMAHEAAETLAQHGQTLGWETVEQVRVPPGPLNVALLVQALRAQGTEIMLILDPRVATATFFHEAHRQAWHPIVLIPGAFAERALLQAPASFEGRLFLAFPTLPTAAAPGDMHAYRRLAMAYKLPPQHLAAQLSALSSAQLLVEGLKRAGREVSRQKLIEILEGLYEFRTGFSLALSYSPNRRIGALGTHIVTLDRNAGTFVPVGTALAPH
jgi:ABC-type branched-subunit amino acid transport system substrate-binding protein